MGPAPPPDDDADGDAWDDRGMGEPDEVADPYRLPITSEVALEGASHSQADGPQLSLQGRSALSAVLCSPLQACSAWCAQVNASSVLGVGLQGFQASSRGVGAGSAMPVHVEERRCCCTV